ncbi:MAG TPA: hypothetical protein VHE12_04350 [bacterium]|nr:hypothetical protein [bacterium]
MGPQIPISYKPSIERDRLFHLILKKLHYKAVNRFIDEAVKEKLNRELVATTDPEMTRLINRLTEVLYEHRGWKFMKPSKEATRKINEKAKRYEKGKIKATRWKGSFDRTFKDKDPQ